MGSLILLASSFIRRHICTSQTEVSIESHPSQCEFSMLKSDFALLQLYKMFTSTGKRHISTSISPAEFSTWSPYFPLLRQIEYECQYENRINVYLLFPETSSDFVWPICRSEFHWRSEKSEINTDNYILLVELFVSSPNSTWVTKCGIGLYTTNPKPTI